MSGRLDEEKDIIDLVLKEFFQLNSTGYTHKRVKEEYDYLTEYYQKKSISEKEVLIADGMVMPMKSKASIPIPIPNPNNNIYDDFTIFWQDLRLKKGSKKNAKMYKRECEGEDPKKLSDLYNKMIELFKINNLALCKYMA